MGKIEHIEVPAEDRERLVKLVKGSQHAAEDCVALADRSIGRRRHWRGRSGEESGQERAHGAALAPSLCRAGAWTDCLKDATRPPGRKPLSARKIKQVVDLTLQREATERHTLE